MRIAVLLYPSAWRRRYGLELQALIDDAAPGWRDLWDVIKGGLTMQLTMEAPMRTIAVWAILGAGLAYFIGIRLPDRYLSENVLLATVSGGQIPASQQQIQDLVQRTMTSERLGRLLETYGLWSNGGYPKRLDRYTLGFGVPPRDENIERLRESIHVEAMAPGRVRLVVGLRVPSLAAQVANQLASFVIEENIKTGRALKIIIVDPARIPEKPAFPNRPVMWTMGGAAGAFLGLIIVILRPSPLQIAS